MSLKEVSQSYKELKGESPKQCKSPEECTELFKLYEKGIIKSKNNVLFFSCQQGHLLIILKRLDGDNYKTVVQKELNISMGLARLRIRVFKLINEYQTLMNSNLSLYYFNQNLKVIKEICEESGEEFK